MEKKRKRKKKQTDCKPVFTDGEYKLMKNYGVGDLMDEIGVNRIMLLRTLDKMNQVMDKLSFRDHLDAMRAISHSTVRIASLLDTREKLYQPYKHLKETYGTILDLYQKTFYNIAVKIYGKEEWERREAKMLLESLHKSEDELLMEARELLHD